MSNGAVHARRRAPAMDAFSRRMIALLRDMIGREARALVEAFPRGVPFDLVEALAGPLPGRVIAQVVGLDPDRWREFAGLVYKMTQGMAPPFPAERWPEIDAAAGRFIGFIGEAVADRRANPRDDFVSAYVAAADKQGVTDEEETLIQLAGIVLAGSDTTRGGIAVAIGMLLEQRSRWEEVLADRTLAANAIHEALRLDPPVGGSPRMTAEPLELDGVTIPPMMPVDLLTISAMRDASLYPDPDRFDLHRVDTPRYHPVFGGGVHRCLGEQLALAELEEALAAVLDLAPAMQLVGERKPLAGFTAVREASPLMVRID
jgi:cytochrome P450